ncbi:MAG: alpha/beta hydrolase [Chloroflexi bacterium]|nr:alpha/beta hydrolase [Chloroflexota bacterium]
MRRSYLTARREIIFKHEYADVNNIRLHYVTEGKGKLIMFLHGFPEFWYEWKNQLAEFGRDYQAVAPDMRGYNLSSKPAEVEQYRMKHLVEDIRALAEHLGHKKFILVAHDWGGGVAWPFAMRHPDYLEKLIIINAPHPITFLRELRDNPAQQKASQYILVHRTPEAEEILSRNNYAVFVSTVLEDGLKQGYFTEEDRKAYIEAWSQPGALTGGLNYYRAAHLGPFTGESDEVLSVDPSLFAVKVPTLVIWGEKDRYLLTGNLEGLDKYVPNLIIKRIPDGSHWVIHEQPELVNGYIREFIEGIISRSPEPQK